MDITSIKTGDVFYYNSYTPHDNQTHHHKCRVLFVGSENIFYDAWWDGINKWTFIPVRKRLTYYRCPFTWLPKLNFDGFEAIDQESAEKLFLKSPEILLRITKSEISKNKYDNTLMNLHSETIAFVPIGPKGGWLKPSLFETRGLTKGNLINKILEFQNLDFIPNDEITIDRIGLHAGVPSYCIKTY